MGLLDLETHKKVCNLMKFLVFQIWSANSIAIPYARKAMLNLSKLIFRHPKTLFDDEWLCGTH